MLGHTWKNELNPNLDDVSFQALLARGAEWAATGKVTLPAGSGLANRSSTASPWMAGKCAAIASGPCSPMASCRPAHSGASGRPQAVRPLARHAGLALHQGRVRRIRPPPGILDSARAATAASPSATARARTAPSTNPTLRVRNSPRSPKPRPPTSGTRSRSSTTTRKNIPPAASTASCPPRPACIAPALEQPGDRIPPRPIRVRLNGQVAAEYPGEPSRSMTGPIGLQLHDRFTLAMFRNIRIRELPSPGVPAAR